MQTHVLTTPFGRRTMTLGQITSQMTARAGREARPEAVVHKWQVFQNIREAREMLGATDRALAILNALLTFHPETVLTGDAEVVVWPSNVQLMARANGMPATTLRRHIAVLVESGLIIRRDSPNGKRFARKGRDGEVEQAYGFDLSPIVARAEEFKDLAEAVQAEKKAFRAAKERLTLLRRDVVKMIETGLEEGIPGDWGRAQQNYQALIGRLPRSAPRQIVDVICADLRLLHAELRESLESFVKAKKPNANESHSGRHIQNSNPESSSEFEREQPNKKEAGADVAAPDNLRSLPKRELPLGIVLDACASLRELNDDVRNWRDFLAAAELARPMLGISPSAWREATAVMGEKQAAITLAAIYQRADQIKNAGGYLRNLTERGRQGKFSTWPMVMALLRAKLDAQKTVNGASDARREDPVVGAPRPRVSEALLKSLQRPKSG
jgi:replication initiation protein RepC